MLACNKVLTLVHRNEGKDGDTYECTQIPNCSWYSTLRTSIVDRGTTMERYTYVRFPVLPEGAVMSRGDFLVNGIVEYVAREKDLEACEHITILDIAANHRNGGVRLPHWKVIGQ